MQMSISSFNHTLEKSNAWLKELSDAGPFNSYEEAYTALRSVLHCLRDRLLVDQAVHLASEMPMLIRGMYYEGWKPAATPHKERTKEDFIESVRNCLRNATNRLEPEETTKAVLHFLNKKISDGEISHVKAELPQDILTLWQ